MPDLTDRSLSELISLAGRVAVITGSGRGTGSAIAARLSEAGAAVVVADADASSADAVAGRLRELGRTAVGMRVHVDDEDSMTTLATDVVERLGAIDVWVNNAGIYPRVPFTELTVAQWDQVIDHNLKGTFLGSREAARRMIAAGTGGVIVNIGSTASFRAATPGMAPYVSSKFGVRGLTKALAVELGGHGIRVLGVAPTFLVTESTRASRADLDDDEYATYLATAGAAKPLGRVGVPDEVARVVLFCVSDLASLMTGSTLAVDAGDLAR